MDPRCKLCIFMGKTDPKARTHTQQSMILVPMDTPGINIIRPLNVFGYEDAPCKFYVKSKKLYTEILEIGQQIKFI